jgi:type II secretion system protein G
MIQHSFRSAAVSAALFLTNSCEHPTRHSPAEADLVSFSSALQMFQLNVGRYPTAAEGLHSLVEKPATLPPDNRWIQIMSRVVDDPWDRPYQYEVGSGSVRIFSTGADPHDPADDISRVIPLKKKQPD